VNVQRPVQFNTTVIPAYGSADGASSLLIRKGPGATSRTYGAGAIVRVGDNQ